MLNEIQTREVVHQELAALGGHLLSEYGTKPITEPASEQTQENPQLASLGGYLLEHYGNANASPFQEPAA
jgi:hypothetical protein